MEFFQLRILLILASMSFLSKQSAVEGEVEVKNGSVTITMDAGSSEFKDCIVTLVGVGTPAEPACASAERQGSLGDLQPLCRELLQLHQDK